MLARVTLQLTPTTKVSIYLIPVDNHLTSIFSMMKISLFAVACALVLSPVAGFSVARPQRQLVTSTARHMFSGAGESAPKEDDPESLAKMEQAAKSMGMSLDEYMVAMNARIELAKTLDSTMVSAGKKEYVKVERDVNNPPKSFKVTVTEEGKALGPEGLSKELVNAVKAAAEESKTGRVAAQKKMMGYISEQLKEQGS